MKASETTITNPLITPEHLRRKVIVYIRQSTMEQVRHNSGSADFQRSQVGLARDYGWPDHLIQVIDEDLGRSGSSTVARSGWKAMLNEIAANKVGAVFAANISRLSRQLIDFETFRVLAAYHKVLLITDGRVIDPADSNDTVLAQVSATIFQFENRKRAQVMRQARMTKARQGIVVSQLPVGWVLGPDGKYAHDPAVKDVIELVIRTFWEVRTLRGTVLALDKEGVQIPSRPYNRLEWRRPNLSNVGQILKNPAYSGTYVYGKSRCVPEQGVTSSGETVRERVPERDWIKFYNALPPYMSIEEQEEIKAILKRNDFSKQYRPGRGSALCQGLLVCVRCGDRLIVGYHRKDGYSYWCGSKTIQAGAKPCSYFDGKDLDRAVEKAVLSVLGAPPVELLREAHAESRRQLDSKRIWIESERERLANETEKALDLVNRSRLETPRVNQFARDRLEEILKATEEFERKAVSDLMRLESIPADRELEELCALAADVPKLWRHPLVSYQERKDIIRALIERIDVIATKEKIEGVVHWKSGQTMPVNVWLQTGRHNLIRELHAEGLSVPEIQERMAAGENSTGQRRSYNVLSIYLILKKLGLKPHRRPKWVSSLREEAAKLYDEGRSMRQIAERFNQRGLKSVSGKPWTKKLVFSLLSNADKKRYALDRIHFEAISEARRRGLSSAQMAAEFNRKDVPRRDNRPWTARAINERWCDLSKRFDHSNHSDNVSFTAVA
jgi:DNA invertase Pin-like site-specific DNA recombinase